MIPRVDVDDAPVAAAATSTGGAEPPLIVMDEIVDHGGNTVGEYTGQVKWWNDKLGFGFATICEGPERGRDIFVHHTGIRPVSSNYRTLRKGEYVNFNITEGHNGYQAVDVTGICGGMLMCDIATGTSGSSSSMMRPRR
jgi:cold shock CspA family protein